MTFENRQAPGDGTFGASYRCPDCGHSMALLANPMETQLLGSLGVDVSGQEIERQPMELTDQSPAGQDDASGGDTAGGPHWDGPSQERLARVPGFIRGVVRKTYSEWAAERGHGVITPEVMDEARASLGL